MDKVIGCSIAAVLVAAINAFLAWLLMLGWNVIAPLFNGPQIGFWHAVAAMVVLSIIGSFFKKSS